MRWLQNVFGETGQAAGLHLSNTSQHLQLTVT